MDRKTASRWQIASTLLLGALLLPAAADAACNSAGCWGATCDFIRIDGAGRIWFTVTDSQSLTNLIPADGCVLRQVWTGVAEPALYVRPDDPDRDEKYSTLLLALSTGRKIGFRPVKDNATGWCSLLEIDISQ